MKKVLWLLLMGVMVFTAKMASADVRLASEQGDPRLIDDVDLIFLGYANKIVDYKDTVDYRLNNNGNPGGNFFGNGTDEWGGIIDGDNPSLGVIGTYVNRPFAPDIYNNEPATWIPTGGSGNWANTVNNLGENQLPGAFFSQGFFQLPVLWFISNPSNKLDLFWGKDLGDATFGIGINYGDSQAPNSNTLTNVTSTPTPVEPTTASNNYSRVLGATVGLGIKNTGFDEFDIHGGYSFGTFMDSFSNTATGSNPVTVDTFKDNGIYTITLGALAQKKMDSDTSARFFADANLNELNSMGSFTNDQTNSGLHTNAGDYDNQFTTSFNSLGLTVGAGLNHNVNNGAAVISSGLVGSYTTSTSKAAATTQTGTATTATVVDLPTDEQDISNVNFVWNIGVDATAATTNMACRYGRRRRGDLRSLARRASPAELGGRRHRRARQSSGAQNPQSRGNPSAKGLQGQ